MPQPSERVVYLLGAGFSAPLGIPVIKDFLIKAKDIYFRDLKKYEHFQPIIDNIDRIHKAKTYFDVDLLNIEEILSILEMESLVTGQDRHSEFEQFIKDVVIATTQPIPDPDVSRLDLKKYESLPTNFHDVLFGAGDWRLYGHFVAALLRLRLILSELERGSRSWQEIHLYQHSSMDFEYSVVTLNYDRVIESIWERIDTCCQAQPRLGEVAQFPLAKLHGCVSGRLTPPTWHKLSNPESSREWSKAYKLLSAATAIRIIGYSMPTADSYIRYLLESAVINSSNLKQIDVICLDGADGALRKKYTQFITFKPFRFANADIRDYLSARGLVVSSVPGQRPIHHDFLGLESVHEEFMRAHSG